MSYSGNEDSDTDSGTATPVLNSGASALGDDGYEEFVEPIVAVAEHNASAVDFGLPNFDGMGTDAANDEDCNILSVEMASMCKELIHTSVACLAKHKSLAETERVRQVSELQTKYCIDMQMQEEIIARERQAIEQLKTVHAVEVAKLESMAEKVASFLAEKLAHSDSTIAKQASFRRWSRSTMEAKRMEGLYHTAEKYHRRNLLWRVFVGIQRDVRRRMKKRLTAESQVKMDDATKEVIVQYELKYKRLTEELEEAHRLLHDETENRKAFEGQLKRVFLKNLTHMNMEANALFNVNHSITATMDAKAEEQYATSAAAAATDPQTQCGRNLPVFMNTDVFSSNKSSSNMNSSSGTGSSSSGSGGLAANILQHQKARVVFASNVASSSAASSTRSAAASSATGARTTSRPVRTGPTAAGKRVGKGIAEDSSGVASGNQLRSSIENTMPRNTGPPMPMNYPSQR